MSQLEIVLIMTNCTRFVPVLKMVQDSFAESYKPGQNQTNEGMIAFKGRLSYVTLLTCQTNQEMN